MADAIVRSKRGVPAKAAKKAPAKHALKKAAKKAAKHPAKHAAKKSARKSAKHVAAKHVAAKTASASATGDLGLLTAFHHMQRATVVISLMAKGSGEDLRDLLDRGVKVYRKAAEGEQDGNAVLRSIGLLRAAEHLAMAGLYEARRKHRQRIDVPSERVIQEIIAETSRRLDAVEHLDRGKGPDLFPVTRELLHQAEHIDDDAHLSYELASAADALCFALENGL